MPLISSDVAAVAYAVSVLGTGADISMTANSYTEIDSSLRVTIVVAATGSVIIRANLCAQMNNSGGGTGIRIGYQLDQTGGVVTTGGFNFDVSNQNRGVAAEYLATGISAGSHTFDLMWLDNTGGSNTLKILRNTSEAARVGCWQSVTTLP